MDFSYIGYTEDKKIVKGTIFASSEEMAGQALAHNGYRIVSLKPIATFVPNWERLLPSLFRIKPQTMIIFSRQLALLLESGIDIVTSLELLQAQASSNSFRRVLGEMVADLRSGKPLSEAISKHPKVFPKIYIQSLSVGERSGGLEIVLRQIADFMETEATTAKGIKDALRYPIIVSVVAFIVIAIIVVFVLPAFTSLYSSLGADLPLMTAILLSAVEWLTGNGLHLILGIFIAVALVFIYIRTPDGRLQWDKLALRLPVVGRVAHLNELARCCRSMSLLIQAGLPLPEIMSLVVEGSDNKVMRNALNDVRQDMLKGEGLSRPMSKSQLFLPMMVQMARVGEETGNLDVTLHSVARSYETEAEDRMHSFIGLIQPAITLLIAVFVAFIAIALISAMYSMYGQVV